MIERTKRLAAGCALGLALLAAPARAQSADDSAKAEKLFTDAAALVEAGQFEAACPKLEESQRLDPALGTQFNLAVCLEHVGKLARAWRNYREVERLARAMGKKGREQSAHEASEALRVRVTHIVFENVPSEVTITLDGVRVDRDEYPFFAMDPGTYDVTATAPVKKTWSAKVVVPAVEHGEAKVVVPALESAVVTTVITQDTSNPRRTLAYAVGGAGVVGIASAIVTGILVLNRKSTAEDDCKPVCADQNGRDAVSSGKTFVVVNAIGWGVGIIGLGVGTYLFLTSKPSTRTAGGLTERLLTGTF